MWRALAIVALTGCGRLFDIEPPVLNDAALGDGKLPGGDASDAGIADSPPDGPGNALCPNTYNTVLPFTTTHYRIVAAGTSWLAAQTACLADQVSNSSRYTHLFVAATDTELAGVETLVSDDVWTGLTDRAIEGAYLWVTAEATNYPPATGAPWGTAQPKASDAEDCILMNATGNLEVRSCGLAKAYVCECDAHASDPLRY